MVFDEISLNAIAKLRRDCSGWWHYPPTVQNKKQTNRNNLLVACSAHTNIGSSEVREGTQLMENFKAFAIKARGGGLGLHLSFLPKSCWYLWEYCLRPRPRDLLFSCPLYSSLDDLVSQSVSWLLISGSSEPCKAVVDTCDLYDNWSEGWGDKYKDKGGRQDSRDRRERRKRQDRQDRQN